MNHSQNNTKVFNDIFNRAIAYMMFITDLKKHIIDVDTEENKEIMPTWVRVENMWTAF
jgi:hypothetical protein